MVEDCIRIGGADWAFEVCIEDPAWDAAVPGWREALARLGAAAAAEVAQRAAEAGCAAPAETALALSTDAAVQELNRDWRGIDKPTNVLSFATWWDDGCPPPPAPGLPLLLGDLAVARETLLAEAAAETKAPADHFAHLVLHGLLHLLGYDHQDAAAAREMESLEIRLLAEIGIADPYGGLDPRGDSDDD
ncbi:rRNA maturation RNase YbeY [Oleispirillum naphthae]|uniref:rRNA maturation RNase YbeY n=1 Tax=Oleispirillum naphthae TaxID=2838853 RepID=UPI0030823FBA